MTYVAANKGNIWFISERKRSETITSMFRKIIFNRYLRKVTDVVDVSLKLYDKL